MWPAAAIVLLLAGWAGGAGAGCHWAGDAAACTVRTLGVLRLQRPPSSLAVLCADPLVEEDALDGLPPVEGLSVERCGVRALTRRALRPPLRHLAVRNARWGAAPLRLDTDAFTDAAQLASLDLSDNGIRTLPPHVFCPLLALERLNLSGNRLADALLLGFSDWGEGPSRPGRTCNVALASLDLAANTLTELPDNAFTSLRALTTLHVQENSIRQMADRALVGLVSLHTLNASSNRLTALPPELFQSSRDLREVYLNNNSISVLAPGLLEGLDQLLVLDLSSNRLTSSVVNRDTFSGLVRLVVLNLARNNIARIDPHLFRDLYSLQILNLEHNRLESLPDEALRSLNNLHALTLSHNRLTTLDPRHLAGLYALNQLYVDHNQLTIVHPHSFDNCSNLHDLGLGGNLLDRVPSAVRQLRFLKSLDLRYNKIRDVASEAWQGLDQVYSLSLIGNEITNITKDSFSSLPSLQVLNLAYNRIERVERGGLGRSGTLHALRLDGNKLRHLDAVSSLPQLVWLNVSANRLQWFDYSLLPSGLEWLDLHDNVIPDLGTAPVLSNLKFLDASGNKLTELMPSSVPDSVETLVLNNNNIQRVAPGTFEGKSNLSRVVLFGNKLETLEPAALRVRGASPLYFLGGNPWRCDCQTEWLQRANEHAQVVGDLESLTCATLHGRGRTSPPPRLLSLSPDRFLCPYESHCFALCHCCDFDACDCEMTCPANCTCYHDHAWGANIVDCSLAGYTSVPPNIPMDATEIYLDGNDLGNLGKHLFIGKKKLKVLYLNNSNVKTLHERTFNGAAALRVLNLEDNELREVSGAEFSQLDGLEELYLGGNQLAHVGDLGTLTGLRVLRVAGASWDSLPRGLGRLEGGLSCPCEAAGAAESWLEATGLGATACAGGLPLAGELARCREAAAAAAVARPAPAFLPLLAAGLAAFGLVLILAVAGFLLRRELCLWAHARLGLRPCRRPDHDDRLYDAYLVYAAKDEEFVGRALAGPLERQGYTLCLHHRDLAAGPAFLAQSVAGAADAARRLVVVASLSFLQEEWARPGLRAAVRACLERGRRRVLVLLTTEPPADPELATLLRSARVVSWGDPRFWAKVRYALPDPRPPRPKAPAAPDAARYTAAPTGWPDHPHSYVTIDPAENIYHTIPETKQYFV